jgi:carbon storage regulator
MLVLSRKKDECIVINNDITIVVVEIRGDKVRLGIEAPKEVPVHRREVFEAIVRGTDDAANPPAVLEVSRSPGDHSAAPSASVGGDGHLPDDSTGPSPLSHAPSGS